MGWHSEDRVLFLSALTNFLSYLGKVLHASVILNCAYNGAFFTMNSL